MTYHQHFTTFSTNNKGSNLYWSFSSLSASGYKYQHPWHVEFWTFTLKNAKILQSFLWCSPIYSLVLFWMLFSHLCSPFVMYVWSTGKGILKKFLIHIGLCPFLPYFPHVRKIQCWKNLSYQFFTLPGTTLKRHSRYRNSLHTNNEILEACWRTLEHNSVLRGMEKCKYTDIGKENGTFPFYKIKNES